MHLRSPELENTRSLALSLSPLSFPPRPTIETDRLDQLQTPPPPEKRNLSLLLNPHQVVRVLHMCRIYLSVPQQTCVLSQGQRRVIVLINLSL